ncbi:hypothetical protein DMENIID0001_131730 [Sergentomyia squamirostris]
MTDDLAKRRKYVKQRDEEFTQNKQNRGKPRFYQVGKHTWFPSNNIPPDSCRCVAASSKVRQPPMQTSTEISNVSINAESFEDFLNPQDVHGENLTKFLINIQKPHHLHCQFLYNLHPRALFYLVNITHKYSGRPQPEKTFGDLRTGPGVHVSELTHRNLQIQSLSQS